jgi:hypothetical protein
MAFPLFKDLGKNSNDLLKKGFPSTDRYAFRVEFDTTSSSGIQFTPHLQYTQAKVLEGELKAKAVVRDFTVTGTGNLKEDVSLEITPVKPFRGTKPTLIVNSNMTQFLDRLKGKVSLEHRVEYASSSASIEAPFQQTNRKNEELPKASVSTVFGSREKGIALGIDAEIIPTVPEVRAINAAAAYSTSDVDFTIFGKTKFNGATTVGASYFQKYPYFARDVQLASEIAYDLSGNSPTFALGGQFKPDDASVLKSRFESKGLLGLSYTEKWKGPLSVTLCAEWNVLGANEASPLQYGIKLAFK